MLENYARPTRFLIAVFFVFTSACGRLGYSSHERFEDGGLDAESTSDMSSFDFGDDTSAPPSDLGMDMVVPMDMNDDLGIDMPMMDLGMDAPMTPAGITVSPTSGLFTSEAGSTATFTVVLDSMPSDDVMVPLMSSDTSEGTVSPGSLTFTSANWNVPQTVTVTGVDDAIADDDQMYEIITEMAASTDLAYDGLESNDVSVINMDDETPGIVVSPLDGLVTNEGGGVASFTIRISTEPSSNVVFNVESSDTTEGTVSSATVTFTPSDWMTPKTVDVVGADDPSIDGDIAYQVEVSVDASSDASYTGFAPIDVELTNLDNDVAGITVTPNTDLLTTEDGDTATFTVSLNSRPTSSVIVALMSSDTTEGTLSGASISIAPANWNIPQTVTITGVNDALADGDQMYTIITAAVLSSDSNYSGMNPDDVMVTNIDNDTPSILVSPVVATTSEAGDAAAISVRLATMPTANVNIAVSSTDTTEGTVSTSSLTFTMFNWATAQTITVTGVDDPNADGNQPYTVVLGIPTTTDVSYAAINPADVALTNTDNDVASVIVTPTSGLTTAETGTTAQFTVRLQTPALSPVTISVMTSDATEGTPSTASIMIPASSVASTTVTVTGINDAIVDGNQPYSIVLGAASSADPAYNGYDPTDVSLVNVDDDVGAFIIAPQIIQTGEPSISTTFNVTLTVAPSVDVFLPLSSGTPSEATVSPAMLTFTPGDWNMPHTVTVTGADDGILDGTKIYSIITGTATSGDIQYNGLNPTDVTGINTDDEFIPQLGSSNAMGDPGDGRSDNLGYSPQLSADGRYLGFISLASNLVAGDTNATSDAFVRDLMLGTTERVSLGPDGTQNNTSVTILSLTPDARYAVFNTGGGATWPASGLSGFLRDRTLSSTVRVGIGTTGAGIPSSLALSMSADGRYVMFASADSTVVPGDTNGTYDIFVRDTVMNVTTRESVATGGGQGNGMSYSSGVRAMSADGRYFVFESESTNLVAGDSNGQRDIFLRDRMSNTTTRLIVCQNTECYIQGLTPDARYLVFGSRGVHVAGDTNNRRDIHVLDRNTSTITRESVDNSGGQLSTDSGIGGISADGRYVAFESASSASVGPSSGITTQAYVRDRVLHTTNRVSINAMGQPANADVNGTQISADGNWIVFMSTATNLSSGDVNGVGDVFVVPRF